jgi:hypothetical protein
MAYATSSQEIDSAAHFISNDRRSLLDTFFDSVLRTSFLYAELVVRQSPDRQISVKKMLINPTTSWKKIREAKLRDLEFNVDKTGLSVVQSTVVEVIAHNAKRQIAPLA